MGWQNRVQNQVALLGFARHLQRHGAVFHAQFARSEAQHGVTFPGIALSQHVHTTAKGGVFQPLLPVVDFHAHAAAQGQPFKIPVPASVADYQLFSSELPRQIQQRIGVIAGGQHQLTTVFFPVEISVHR
ncbi:hypothetical protein D3C72_1108820 [compost metagenome]